MLLVITNINVLVSLDLISIGEERHQPRKTRRHEVFCWKNLAVTAPLGFDSKTGGAESKCIEREDKVASRARWSVNEIFRCWGGERKAGKHHWRTSGYFLIKLMMFLQRGTTCSFWKLQLRAPPPPRALGTPLLWSGLCLNWLTGEVHPIKKTAGQRQRTDIEQTPGLIGAHVWNTAKSNLIWDTACFFCCFFLMPTCSAKILSWFLRGWMDIHLFSFIQSSILQSPSSLHHPSIHRSLLHLSIHSLSIIHASVHQVIDNISCVKNNQQSAGVMTEEPETLSAGLSCCEQRRMRFKTCAEVFCSLPKTQFTGTKPGLT